MHECGKVRSKLNMIYSNHSGCDHLNRAYGCVALPWVACSAHRPVAFSRKIPELASRPACSIDASTLADLLFAHRVALELDEKQADDSRRLTSFRNLLVMKRATWVAAGASNAACREQCASSKEDDFWHVLGFL